MRVIWSAKALAELDRIRCYIEDRNPDAARRVSVAIVQAESQLADYPRLGVVRPNGAYVLTLARHPYRLGYAIKADQIMIATVRHWRWRTF